MTSLNSPVLVVDDEADIRDLMEMTLMKMGLDVDLAEGVQAAKKKLGNNKYSLVLTDMRMPDGSGLEVVEYITEHCQDVPVAVITAFGNADQAVQAMKIGAFDYLQKPITLAQLRTLVKSAIKVQDEENKPLQPASAKVSKTSETMDNTTKLPETDEDEIKAVKTVKNQVQKSAPKSKDVPTTLPEQTESVDVVAKDTKSSKTKSALKVDNDLPRLKGSSPQIEQVRTLIRKLANTQVPVYISGESGTGKEQAARSIHESSSRKDGPFIAVNCGAIPENLMESEFFGYKKGSFTGADQDRLGFFQHAHGGTLFLDEVADLPLAMQVKLLRAIQEKAVRRIGDAQEVHVDVRIISATHKNLAELVDKGSFRQDLFYRLNVVSLAMPALREMREDLDNFIAFLLRKYSNNIRMTASAHKELLRYNYPGNFRELENILERAVALASNNIIDVDDLQIHFMQETIQENESDTSWTDNANESFGVLENFQLGKTQLQDYLDDVEREILEYALRVNQGNRTQAAKALGISFRSIRYRLDRLNIV